MNIRAARADDADDVLRLWLEAEAEPTVTDHPDGFKQLISRDPEALLVALDGNEIVGTVICGFDGWRGNMYRLAVAPSHRRRGIARELVAAAERRLHELGCRRITALVLGHEPAAVAFWAAVGYDVQPEMNRYRKNL